MTRKVQVYEQNISNLTRENEEMKRRIGQYEQNISSMNREIE